MAAGLAHEVNNPNGLILLNLPILKDVYGDALETLEERYREQGDFQLGGLPYSRMRQEVPHMLEDMSEGAARIKRIVEDLKDYARQDTEARKEPFDLNSVAQAALRLVDTSIRKATGKSSTRRRRCAKPSPTGSRKSSAPRNRMAIWPPAPPSKTARTGATAATTKAIRRVTSSSSRSPITC